MKPILVAAALTLALLITPVKAYDEFVSQKLSEVKKDPSNKGLVFRVITDAERKNLDQALNVPMVRKGTMMLATAEGMTMIVIVRDDIIVGNSPPVSKLIMDQLLQGKVPAKPVAPPKGEKL
jgi:hypothetical protein